MMRIKIGVADGCLVLSRYAVTQSNGATKTDETNSNETKKICGDNISKLTGIHFSGLSAKFEPGGSNKDWIGGLWLVLN